MFSLVPLSTYELSCIMPAEAIVQRHQLFYYPDGTHVFRVSFFISIISPVLTATFQAQNTLFKVHQSVLSDKAIFFKTMFCAPCEAGYAMPYDGKSDDNPIIVPDQVTAAGFELFLCVCYNK